MADAVDRSFHISEHSLKMTTCIGLILLHLSQPSHLRAVRIKQEDRSSSGLGLRRSALCEVALSQVIASRKVTAVQ